MAYHTARKKAAEFEELQSLIAISHFPAAHQLMISLHLNMQFLILTVRSDIPFNSKLPYKIKYKLANQFKENFPETLKELDLQKNR